MERNESFNLNIPPQIVHSPLESNHRSIQPYQTHPNSMFGLWNGIEKDEVSILME